MSTNSMLYTLSLVITTVRDVQLLSQVHKLVNRNLEKLSILLEFIQILSK